MPRTPTKPTSNDTKPPVIPPPNAPILTQENFEKELKGLAARAKEETWGKWAGEQAWILLQSATLLSLAAVYSNISQLTLSPVYGSIPASIWHSKGVMAACFLGWSTNLLIRRHVVKKPAELLPLIAAYIPVVQFTFFKFSDVFGPNYGPLILESLTFIPLLLLSVSCTATHLDNLEMNPGRLQWLSDAAPGILSYMFYKIVETFSGKYISETIGNSVWQTRLGYQMLLTALYMPFAPPKKALLMMPAIFHWSLMNLHVPVQFTTNRLNADLNSRGWNLIDRKESITGYVSVLENPSTFKVMRCDHSLLGGEWLAPTKAFMPEPIYGVFVMLEAVRLVGVPVEIADEEASALVIGLGIGTTPAALMQHGIDTTIVEIDPVVHDYATKYFNLPTGHTKVIQDAVIYASEAVISGQKYDYVIHDVFTGGVEPVNLFTLEFLTDLHRILKPGGVIALNYAGDLLLPSARIVIHTIKTVFPSCRIFREHPRDNFEDSSADFTNMVIFCINSDAPINFRKPVPRDFLSSGTRESFLVPKHEVLEEHMAIQEEDGVLLRNGTERFRKWQEQNALGHWAVMRTVLPKEIWENW
ncbi:S-adenosyl-L-methionine-dependent methyltransferase [Calycina marina]|uniref:S-adenosyl-L-methionine-dependent methyltransferase n=1 Tax=Calycina marina TaxID=1763456 RepID=A0A9P7Z076_9HELO|nr:S-adenosyl-L-methionine-dependent methyltransferase [Calycina marina]